MSTRPHNPFLADSGYAIAHGRCDQQDDAAQRGPEGPTAHLTPDDIQYSSLGPCHFGGLISSPDATGRRTIWSNGRHTIAKLDYDTLEVLAELSVSDESVLTDTEIGEAVAGLDEQHGDAAIGHAMGLALRFMTGLDGVYSLLDCDNTLFLGRSDGAIAYCDADPTDPMSPIIERDRWVKPDHIEGNFVGINITFDGRLVMTTDLGWVVCLSRDFAEFDAVQLRGADAAPSHNAKMEAERGHTAYGWVRTSVCVDDANGIYVSSLDHTHKVVWTGERLSNDEADGAWSAEYRNGTGTGSGTTPCLMGFDDDDRFVVIGDGDDVVNITLFWRDEIPSDWEQLPDAPSRRIAGLGPAHMGDPSRASIQTEQSITVSGYGAMTVNNEPASTPENFPERGVRLLAFFLGHHAEYTPHGLHKYEWDPDRREFREAWVNTDVASPNSVPFVSAGSDLVYTCGTRDGLWTVEAVNWSTGASSHHYVVGNSRFNTLCAGISLDEQGRLLFGNIFGKTRLLVPAGPRTA